MLVTLPSTLSSADAGGGALGIGLIGSTASS